MQHNHCKISEFQNRDSCKLLEKKKKPQWFAIMKQELKWHQISQQ